MGSVCLRALLFRNENMSALNICLRDWDWTVKWNGFSTQPQVKYSRLWEMRPRAPWRGDLDFEKPRPGWDQAGKGRAAWDGSIKHVFSSICLNSAPFVREISAPSCSPVLKTYVGLCRPGSCGNHGGPGETSRWARVFHLGSKDCRWRWGQSHRTSETCLPARSFQNWGESRAEASAWRATEVPSNY